MILLLELLVVLLTGLTFTASLLGTTDVLYSGPPGGGGTPLLGHIRDLQPEWVSFPGQKPVDGS